MIQEKSDMLLQQVRAGMAFGGVKLSCDTEFVIKQVVCHKLSVQNAESKIKEKYAQYFTNGV